MGVVKFPYLHPRTAVTPIKFDTFLRDEQRDRTFNKAAWEGDSARRQSCSCSVTEEYRAWLDRAIERASKRAERDEDG